MEITPREIITSIIIIVIMSIIGFWIHENIMDLHYEELDKYNTSLKIDDDAELFQYAINTQIGDILVSGNMSPIDTVTYPEVNGEFIFIEEIKQEYVQKTRTVTYTEQVNGESQTKTRLETYWEWDTVDRSEKTVPFISFCGQSFKTSEFQLPSNRHISDVNTGYHTRNRYYGIPATLYPLTLFVNASDTVTVNKYYYDDTIESIIEYIESSGIQIVILFWIFWILLIGGAIYLFYYMENKWLE